MNQTMEQLFSQTMEREKILKSLGYTMRTIWECDFDRLCKSEPRLRTTNANNTAKPRLEPRNALYGGRVNATVLHYACKDDEKICHDDVVSEIPHHDLANSSRE